MVHLIQMTPGVVPVFILCENVLLRKSSFNIIDRKVRSILMESNSQ